MATSEAPIARLMESPASWSAGQFVPDLRDRGPPRWHEGADVLPRPAIAREKGGLCLSTKSMNSYTRLRWRCAEGHEWPPMM
jgi:hypothetical protein